jgi:enoyl-CoA hydratase/carnithine racemase
VSTSRVLFEIDGAIAFLTFNRPEARNAMTWDMYDALVAACDHVDRDRSIRVFVLRGAGDKAFVSGTDIGQFTRFESHGAALAYERRIDETLDRLERVQSATIAQVQGAAMGGGCMMAMACDLRVCAPEARFGVPIARTLGNCLSAANYARLVGLIGPGRAKDLLFTGRALDAAEADRLGLVTRVAERDRLDDTVRELAATIAANAPLTVLATKESIRRLAAARRLDEGATSDLIEMCYGSDDFREGVASFLAKRRPQFRGR